MDYFRNQYLLEFQRAAKQNLMVSWQAVEQRGALMTRRHLQRLTEGVYHFSRRTQSTVELWYPWVSSRPLTLPVFLSINFIARGPLAWHLLLFIRFFNFIRTICLRIYTFHDVKTQKWNSTAIKCHCITFFQHYPQSPPGTCEFRRKTSTSWIAKSVIYSSIYIQITPQNISQNLSYLQDRLQFFRNNKDSIQIYVITKT
jgi:hypothetical protein